MKSSTEWDMATSVLNCSSSQESALYDDGIFNEIQKHVDINNLPILEGEEFIDRKHDLLIKHDASAEQFSMDPLQQMAYNQMAIIQTNMDIPIKEEFPGDYNFEVLLNSQGSGKNCVFSQALSKVFINMEQTLPLRFKWNPPLHGLWLRTMMVFSMDQYRSDPVQRCHNHIATNSVSNQNVDERILRHVVRCTHPDSIYEENNGHMSVSVPLSTPQPGSLYVPLGFQFFCKNSCSSGMNRRCTELVFTLETAQRQVIGRRILKVRVCSCPKRDKDKEEQESNGPVNLIPGKKRKLPGLSHPPPGKKPLSGNSSTGQHDTREYNITLKIPGKDNARAILNYAFDRLAGESLRTGAFPSLSPYIEEINKKIHDMK